MATISQGEIKKPLWQTVAMFTVAFWLSASLMVDFVIMPSLYVGGMMTESGFASTGYLIFWMFNRIELLCAAVIMTGALIFCNRSYLSDRPGYKPIILSAILLVVALVDTYALTPQMTAMAAQLNLFDPIREFPSEMALMQQGYWFLEIVKLILMAILLGFCYRQSEQI